MGSRGLYNKFLCLQGRHLQRKQAKAISNKKNEEPAFIEPNSACWDKYLDDFLFIIYSIISDRARVFQALLKVPQVCRWDQNTDFLHTRAKFKPGVDLIKLFWHRIYSHFLKARPFY
jgi:hypothetical protein